MIRVILVLLLILLQIFGLVVTILYFCKKYILVSRIIRFICAILVINIINQQQKENSKLSWTFWMLLFPEFGLLFYLLFRRTKYTKITQKTFHEFKSYSMKSMKQCPSIHKSLMEQDKIVYRQTKYIHDWSGYPVYKNTQTTYYSCGEDLFPDLLAELEKAKHYIFLEFFIVENGSMFGKIREILERKAANGVDVRLIFDDMGSVLTLPYQYRYDLEKRGIKTIAFNPLRPYISPYINHRDHRKIIVIDGLVGFTGGFNLADEYINVKEKYGYWKDNGICIKGEAVWSFTVMFLSLWNYLRKEKEAYERFRPIYDTERNELKIGYIQPYCDNPYEQEYICANVYKNIIHQAMEYVYLFTPYLILDCEMIEALKNAAKRGVDVRIITPGIPDKKMVYILSQSYYETLLNCGVKIYQYKPGFLHAKSVLCDDKIATVGSVNMDYRSLYLHFECSLYMYQTAALKALKKDFEETLKVSDEVTISFCKGRKVGIKCLQYLMHLVAPFC